jgi:hypothetical protein
MLCESGLSLAALVNAFSLRTTPAFFNVAAIVDAVSPELTVTVTLPEPLPE